MKHSLGNGLNKIRSSQRQLVKDDVDEIAGSSREQEEECAKVRVPRIVVTDYDFQEEQHPRNYNINIICAMSLVWIIGNIVRKELYNYM